MTDQDRTIAVIDAFRAWWIAIAQQNGIDHQVAIAAHEDYVRELGIDEASLRDLERQSGSS